jgi:hypothetical protein
MYSHSHPLLTFQQLAADVHLTFLRIAHAMTAPSFSSKPWLLGHRLLDHHRPAGQVAVHRAAGRRGRKAKDLYPTFVVPASSVPLFQAAPANPNPWTEAKWTPPIVERCSSFPGEEGGATVGLVHRRV